MPRFIDISGAHPIGAAPQVRTAIDAATRSSLVINVKDYGAVGNGETDDTTAINAAFTAATSSAPFSSTIYFPPGNFVYNGTGLSSQYPRIVGAAHEATTITLGASSYLINSGLYFYSLLLRDLKIMGGKGAVKHSFTGNNVAGMMLVQNCKFQGYTECAVATDSEDMPFWHFRDCLFYGANTTTTIGAALGGNPDQSTFDSCAFELNRVHVKLRRAGVNVHITNTSFLQFSGVNSSGPRVAVWVVPDSSTANAGNGMTITRSKFGNENLVAGDYRILYADEGSGATNGVKFPALGTDSTGYVQAHVVADNLFGGNATGPHPIVYSTTPNVWDLQIVNNVLGGTLPKYCVEFKTPPTGPDRLNASSIFGPFTGNMTEAVLPFPSSNAYGIGCRQDPQGVAQLSNSVREWPSGSSTSFVELLTTPITGFLTSSASKSNITDAYGGADAITLTMTTSGASLYNPSNLATNAISGMPVWVEFDLKNPNDGNAASQIFTWVQAAGGGTLHWRRCIEVPSVDKGWVTYAFSFTPRTAADVVYLVFSATGAGEAGKTVSIGRPRVYQANERQLGGRRPSIAAAGTDAATTQTLANDLRTKLISLGIIKAT